MISFKQSGGIITEYNRYADLKLNHFKYGPKPTSFVYFRPIHNALSNVTINLRSKDDVLWNSNLSPQDCGCRWDHYNIGSRFYLVQSIKSLVIILPFLSFSQGLIPVQGKLKVAQTFGNVLGVFEKRPFFKKICHHHLRAKFGEKIKLIFIPTSGRTGLRENEIEYQTLPYWLQNSTLSSYHYQLLMVQSSKKSNNDRFAYFWFKIMSWLNCTQQLFVIWLSIRIRA